MVGQILVAHPHLQHVLNVPLESQFLAYPIFLFLGPSSAMTSIKPPEDAGPDLQKDALERVNSGSGNVESASVTIHEAEAVPQSRFSKLGKWNQKIENLAGLEARGIERVPVSERQEPSTAAYIQMSLIWFSANITANNMALGLLGPLVYDLSFTDAALCSVFGGFVGCLGTSYMGTWGAVSGNRTLVRTHLTLVFGPRY